MCQLCHVRPVPIPLPGWNWLGTSRGTVIPYSQSRTVQGPNVRYHSTIRAERKKKKVQYFFFGLINNYSLSWPYLIFFPSPFKNRLILSKASCTAYNDIFITRPKITERLVKISCQVTNTTLDKKMRHLGMIYFCEICYIWLLHCF
jgi:hypothetical protein